MSENGHEVKWPPGESLDAATLHLVQIQGPVKSEVVLGSHAQAAHERAMFSRASRQSRKRKT